MRLFHVSEEADIRRFKPRRPTRVDLDPETGLVWAIDEKHLPNFLAPRDCPRVAYSVREDTTTEDRERFFTSKNATHALILEHGWLNALRSTTLYLYEFDPAGFILQDSAAGYYIATTTQVPIRRIVVDDIPAELARREVELRFTDSLWDIAERIRSSTLDWSLCRMKNARPKPK